MTCHDIGTLQAYLDGEVSRDEKKSIMKHLESCEACREQVAELQNLHFFCTEALEEKKTPVDTEGAWATFEARLQQIGKEPVTGKQELKTRKGWHSMSSTVKKVLVSGVAAAAIFSSFAIPQVQVGASQFLSLFRVDQFEMVQLTQNDLSEIENWVSENEAGEIDLKGIGKLERTGASGEPKQFDSAEAAAAAGYSVPQLDNYSVAGVHVIPASTITFTLDIEKANQLLGQLGSDEEFPAALDGQPFSVAVFDAVTANYAAAGQPITYIRTKSPEINVPEGVSIAELRDTLLSLPFIPENVKTQLAGITDIESTLPIPAVTTDEAQVSEVSVNGAEGFTVNSDHETSVVWNGDGQIHMIVSENGTSTEELIALAAQIQ
ncbi:anti-sigma factor family protein [Planococcus lenghuensis]|uniref:Anti-sigma-W factor RsiW n=1 Tax=Planococcus lenghuensis TaxID=2213202 RepID=A0A1Q2KYW1_9BACL|nr:zf-HC2 domain-containing protein [Planococcus lenghuensis]AQQ53316.1 hypothetical protein B0X71_09655 [Planococcus lenghuensis]